MRKFQAAAGGGMCRLCKIRLPEWDPREICDTCLGECRQMDEDRWNERDDVMEDDDAE